jgi:hypothetical protein
MNTLTGNEENRDSTGNSLHKERKTFIVDTVRRGVDGIMVSLIQTVFLLVAIRAFDVSDLLKSLLSSAHYLGFMGALFYTTALSRTDIRKSILAALPAILSGGLLLIAAFPESGPGYVLAGSFAIMCHALSKPFVLGIYGENYRPDRRGRLLSVGLVLSIIVGIVTNSIFGKALDGDIFSYRPIFIVSGGLLVTGSALFFMIPTSPPHRGVERNPFRCLSLLLTDTRFGMIMLSWFIFGFANLWSTPIRIVYLAEAERGLGLSPLLVMIIMGIIPEVVKLMATPVWGYFFDKYDFDPPSINVRNSWFGDIPFFLDG